MSVKPKALPTARTVNQPDEDPEFVWLRDTYRPNEANLTIRAALVGMVIGAIMCLSNLYVFFKTGWSMGVTLTACVLAFAAFKGLRAAGIVKRPLGVLENNALTTVASGAGFMTGGGNMAAYGALLMIISAQPHIAKQPSTFYMIIWFAAIAALGVFAAIPIKRQLINKEALPFPTGTATALTIQAIHAEGSKSNDAKWLGIGALVGAAVTVLRDMLKWVPEALHLPYQLAGVPLAKWTLTLKTEVVLLGGGALMSFRTGWSLLLGGVLTYVFMAPELLAQGLIKGATYKQIVAWTLWPGAAILVGSGLTSFALDYKSLGRALGGIVKIGNRKNQQESGIAAVEVPDAWFPIAFLALSPIVILLMTFLFQIPMWAGLIAMPLAVLMGFIAARVTGETDITPTKALGPVTQMAFGVMTPGNLTGNIMSANVTGGIGLHAADLLTTLKTGWLLGAKPRHQLYAQLFGVFAGAIVVAPAFALIIPDPSVLGSDAWPAPSCTVWKGVSEAFANGLGALHSSSITAIWVGLALGVTLTLAEKFAPKSLRAFIPSANGLGMAMVIPASNAFAMFLGAGVGEYMRRKGKESYVVPIASGLIAGESIMGIFATLLAL